MPQPGKTSPSKEVFENYPGVFSLDADVEAMAKKLDREKKEVREWATKKLKTQMLETAHSLDLQWNGQRVNKFSDIGKSWDENQSDANAKKMYEIMFGGFEGSNSAWSMNWERKFLEKHDRHYLKEATNDGDKTKKNKRKKMSSRNKQVSNQSSSQESARNCAQPLSSSLVIRM